MFLSFKCGYLHVGTLHFTLTIVVCVILFYTIETIKCQIVGKSGECDVIITLTHLKTNRKCFTTKKNPAGKGNKSLNTTLTLSSQPLHND